ncbi:hypothetical protein PVAP13_8KG080468 [Panicum virgatum]|uniref:Uncharacterized protein n=1 Tax=Panicum virgatum TaxID=38727 RepID=A0A8T0PEQ8_PANVG|nr:hypothetical protein PVAP13_8KG080468 [Panicum virgatum]
MGMRFDDHEVVYPTVPEQGANNFVSDVPCIRINIANDLMFIPANTGLKRLVTSYRKEEEE